MNKIKLDTYSFCSGFFMKDKNGLLLDMSELPEEYEIIIRSIKNKKKQQVIYQNLKERS